MTLEMRRNYNLHDVAFESFAAFALHLGAAWGFRVDLDRVLVLERELTERREANRPTFIAAGFLREQTKKGVLSYVKTGAVIKRRVAAAYGCVKPCATCGGTGKVQSAKSGKLVGDRACDSTGLDLDSALVPRTTGSKCRTCRGSKFITIKGQETAIPCGNCVTQPEVIPGCQASRDTLRESGDEDLIEFAAFLEDAKLLETYLPFLKQGIVDVPVEDDDDSADDDSGGD